MNYRIRNYAEAARLMDEQIQRYAAGIEAPQRSTGAAASTRTRSTTLGRRRITTASLSATYVNYYYAELARQRLAVLGTQAPAAAPAAVLSCCPPAGVPTLTGELPENETHLIKARLLANAALNEYIGPEIQASPTSRRVGSTRAG